jgi:hypothetical protein
MSLKGKEYLEELVNSVVCIPDAFRVYFELKNEKYIISSVFNRDQRTDDYYAVSAIYDTIVDIDIKIKYSFSQTMKCDLPETLERYDISCEYIMGFISTVM